MLDEVVALPKPHQPRFVFVVVSISGMTVAVQGWTALYRDYITKLKSAESFVLLRQEYACDLSAAPLEDTRRQVRTLQYMLVAPTRGLTRTQI